MKPSIFNFQFSIFILVLATACNHENNPTSQANQPKEVKITTELNYLLKPANAAITSSIKIVLPVAKVLDLEVKANGVITYDTRRSTSIPVRFGGRIEKLLIKYNFQPVSKGQKILEIYSPELRNAQRDLLYLLKTDKENKELINGAKQKLQLLGISDSQLAELLSTGKESNSFSVYSPVDGYVVEEVASQLTNELATREGMYVNAGQSIFRVVNTDQVWAEFDVYQRDAASIKANHPVRLTFDNATEEMEAKVNFIQPFFKSGESFVKVRCYLSNPGNKFSIGQLVTVSFSTPSGNSLWIPRSARLDLGAREIAFIKRRGVFRPRAIVTAQQSRDWIEIVSGLESTDSVAYNAQFMVDSESFIKVTN
jgi:membrane fusion protein, copper/silver efflux system